VDLVATPSNQWSFNEHGVPTHVLGPDAPFPNTFYSNIHPTVVLSEG